MQSRLRHYDEPGHTHFRTVSCCRRLTFFWHDAMKRVVVGGLRVLQQRFGVCLVAYVVTPEHLHLLPHLHAKGEDSPVPISQLRHASKKHARFHGKQCLRHLWRPDGKLSSEPLSAWAHGNLDKQIIMPACG